MMRSTADWGGTELETDLPPLRGESFSVEHLDQLALELASTLQTVERASDSGHFSRRFRDNSEFLQVAYQRIAADAREGEPITPDVEWLLDNFYVVEEQLREIRDDLPPAYYRELPKLSDGVPRIYRLVVDLLTHTDSSLDEQTVSRFVGKFQTLAPLSMGEVWAIPIMLRLGLVENLRRLATHMLGWRSKRDRAQQITAQWQPGSALPQSVRLRTDSQLAMHLWSAVAESSSAETERLTSLEQQLNQVYPDTEELIHTEHQRQAANQVTIGNVITSMRLISALDWVSFFEQNSLAEQALRDDPADVYSHMDFESRDRYRHVVEQLAKGTRHSDLDVARQVVQLARNEGAANVLAGHVGYWLIDEGRRRLEQQLQYHPKLSDVPSRWCRTAPSLVFLGSIGLWTTVGVALIALAATSAGCSWPLTVLFCLIGLLPISDCAVHLTNLLVTHILRPRLLPKLELKAGIPDQFRTIVVVPSMLTSPREVTSLVDRLELHYLANPDHGLAFALLTDLADADVRETERDADLVQQAIAGIRRLNTRYGRDGSPPFYLFHRERRWNANERVWMGWERKRGKLMEFNQLLRGRRNTSYLVQEGDLAHLLDHSTIQFVITLDADTEMPHGVARRLIGAMAHPLNRPRFRPGSHIVTGGYGLLQPRVTVQLENANRSYYASLFANSKGIDPYATASSDVYQDLYGEGSFTGKGIYDVDAFERALDGAFGENQILSHDLIEGCHTRAGLVSDIELIDGFPTRYDADARRQHRWARGDWQILPWIFPRVPAAQGSRSNPLSAVSRWKILDNVRRSLVAPLLMLFLLLGWYLAPAAAWWWSLAALTCVAFPTLATIATSLHNLRFTVDWFSHLRTAVSDIGRSAAQSGVMMALLPHKALSMTDAIVRTIARLTLTRRRLLEWETAAAAEKRLSQGKWSSLLRLWYVPALAIVLAFTMPRPALPAAAVWLFAWLAAPLVAHVLNQPIVHRRSTITDDDRLWLRRISRKTWSYFEACVTEERNWLPPDNVQEYPEVKVAERISPTNEGLFLVSGLVAREFGYIGQKRLIQLFENNLDAWSSLPRLRGHFYNWYDTQSRRPLLPRYVSTVDSGNLAASFLVAQQGALELVNRPILSRQMWNGLQDTLQLVDEACANLQPRGARMVIPPLDALSTSITALRGISPQPPETLADWAGPLASMGQAARSIREKLAEFEASRQQPAQQVSHAVQSVLLWIDDATDDLISLCPWLKTPELLQLVSGRAPAWCQNDSQREVCHRIGEVMQSASSLVQLEDLQSQVGPVLDELDTLLNHDGGDEATRQASRAALADFRDQLASGGRLATYLALRFRDFAHRTERLALEMDFRFLYNERRRLFSIGYNLEDSSMDRSFYDLLCSEARLTSYVAVAKGDVPPRHWFALGRQATWTAGRPGLLSWGGTMFEYLMPPLFLRMFESSLLSRACDTAIARQQEYGQQLNIPWGMSESAYGALAINSDYHYQSFGVPGLGLKRGLSKDRVVAPYSTAMALPITPAAAVANLRRLEAEGATGRWGFFDALDFTPERVPVGKTSTLVRCYMAHHQGMSFLGLAGLLLDHPVQRWLHAHPMIRATELLLQERMPTAAPSVMPHTDETVEVRATPPDEVLVSRRLLGHNTHAPRTHLLSNGQYSVMLTSTGGGYSRWNDLAITRWRPDTTRDDWGQFLYLRDLDNGRVWSPTYQPTNVEPDAYEVIYSIDKAEYRRRDGDLETQLEVTVSPENNAEVRLLKITNHGWQAREIEITSYAEVVLAPPAADQAHPAFQKLFIETEYVPGQTALLARRRPRDSQQPVPWALHVLSCSDANGRSIEYESSRVEFLGRGRSTHSPRAMDPGQQLTGSTGLVLDPIFSLRCRVTVRSKDIVVIACTTGYADSREAALRLADQYHDLRGVTRAFELSWAYNQVQLRHLHLTAAQAQQFQRLASAVLYPQSAARGSREALLQNTLGQNGLWRFGISGDRPIVLAQISKAADIAFIRELVAAREYWSLQGLKADLVVLNVHPGSYLDELQEQLQRMIAEWPRSVAGALEGVFLLRGSTLASEDRKLLETTANLVLRGEQGWNGIAFLTPSRSAPPAKPGQTDPSSTGRENRLSRGLFRSASKSSAAVVSRSSDSPDVTLPITPSFELEFWNGIGGFARNGHEYHIRLSDSVRTPMPWSNVIANPRLGCVVTESGGGFTWFSNSRENKLTSWANDPVADTPSELLFCRDEQTGAEWSPFAGCSANTSGDFHVQHAQGASRFLHSSHGVAHEVTVAVAAEDPVKFIRIVLRNEQDRVRQLSLTFVAEWVLGVAREQTQLHIITEADPEHGAILARNAYHPDYPHQVAFLKILGPDRSYSGDRAEVLGRNTPPQQPSGLGGLSGATGAGLDPCGAVQSQFTLPALGEKTICILLGAGDSREEARQVMFRYPDAGTVTTAIDAACAAWDDLLGGLQIETPDRSLDILVNRWLLYQVTSCRFWGRSGYYQAGGAYGFRDQLQDVMALVYTRPDLARAHLLRAAARQFEEGDVQHWWHPPTGRGTRTRFSDDLLWLPLTAAHYVAVTGDESILDDVIPFLQSPRLDPHEQERYELPTVSARQGSFYAHCLMTIARGFRVGERGIPLMGCGDWNDGMSNVGPLGRGESVWVGWFLIVVLEQFIPLIERRGDGELASEYRERISALRRALETSAWDGGWYRRAWFDDGTPLGSRQNEECQIDSLSQTWAIMAGADPGRTDQALAAVFERLVKEDEGLVALLTPAFNTSNLEPGYIKGYLPGVRENGGQYTHAVAWLIHALTLKRDGRRAVQIYDLVNPICHTRTPEEVQKYQVEPYVMAADVYSVAPHTGRGGWTWYTGSAAWMYRVAIESILGFEVRDGVVRFHPCVPDDWNSFQVRYRFGKTLWEFDIHFVNHGPTESTPIELLDDGQPHRLTIQLGRQSGPLGRRSSDERSRVLA